MQNFKITLFLLSGFMHMLINMENKLFKTIMLLSVELKFYKNKEKDGTR